MAKADEYREEAARLRETAALVDLKPDLAVIILEIARLYEQLAYTIENTTRFLNT